MRVRPWLTNPTAMASGRNSPNIKNRHWNWLAQQIAGTSVRIDSDYYTQPGLLFRLMSKDQQQVLFENTARAMGDAPDFIKKRHIENCMKADPVYGKGVAKALGLSMD